MAGHATSPRPRRGSPEPPARLEPSADDRRLRASHPLRHARLSVRSHRLDAASDQPPGLRGRRVRRHDLAPRIQEGHPEHGRARLCSRRVWADVRSPTRSCPGSHARTAGGGDALGGRSRKDGMKRGLVESLALEGTALMVTLAPTLPVEARTLAASTARLIAMKRTATKRMVDCVSG